MPDRLLDSLPCQGCRTIICEFHFESFNAHGDDAYLDGFAVRLDALYAAGWKLIESRRDANRQGWWQVELFKGTAGELAVTGDR